jgi:phenylacetate-CoA ligase
VIYEIRDKKICDLIKYAYNYIPYYREKFDERDINPDRIKGFNDLSCLPILSKLDILTNEHNLISHNCSQKLYTRKTSGSTGMTLHFQKEARALALNDAVMYRCYAWYGIDIGDKQVRFWGVPVDPALRRREKVKDFILNRIRISAFDISEQSCLAQYQRIKRFRPAYFYGYTTAIYGFCSFAQKLGLDLNTLGLRAVICTAEKMYPHHQDLFDKVFKCPVVDEYGSSENGIIAFQCKEGSMHVMADHLAVEFVDEAGQRVKPGELGRIVITDLNGYAMPLIRYEIGDMGRYTEQACSCGVTLPVMDIIEGRKEDFIRTREGKLIHAAYLCYTLKDDAVHEFKMYQKDLNRFLVQIVKSNKFNADSQKKLEHKLRTALGDSVVFEFQFLERIPREASGKLRYFISEIR